MSPTHTRRIYTELRNAGMTRYGMSKMATSYLPSVIHENEHIHGVIYGKSSEGHVMLVATDKRVLYIDRKPFFTVTDELSYDIISGIRISIAGLFVSVIVHTRAGEFSLKYVNRTCARIFAEYIEKQRIER